jgi:hypothetical protein
MTRQEIIATLHEQRGILPATELAELLFRLTGRRNSANFVFTFFDAFPSIPLDRLKIGLLWRGIRGEQPGSLSDEEFNRLFHPWLSIDPSAKDTDPPFPLPGDLPN